MLAKIELLLPQTPDLEDTRSQKRRTLKGVQTRTIPSTPRLFHAK
jgi:hypothetical protein